MGGEHQGIHRMFDQAAERFAERVAVEGAGGGTVTYRALAARSERLAAELLAHGTPPGARVAILADDAAEVIAAMLATLRAGCAFVPLDVRMPEARLAAMVAQVTPHWLLSEPAVGPLAARLAAAAASPVRLLPLGEGGEPAPPGAAAPREVPAWDPDGLCYIYFTSGSTGAPKGIAGRLRAIDHFVRWEIDTLGLDAGVRVSQLTSPAFDAFLRDAFVPLCAGGTVCAPPRRAPALSGAELAAWLARARVAVLHCVPSMLRLLLAPGSEQEAVPLPDLRFVAVAGEPLLPADVGRWLDRFGDGPRLVNLYGPSETTMTKFCHFVEAADRHRATVPVGRPIRGARALVLDPAGAPCAPGVTGEIVIRTPYSALGYWGRPDLTREAFVPNPLTGDAGDLVYRTGDLGRVLPDGSFELAGRKDRQLKLRGVRVEPGEIESVLLAHPGVAEAAVTLHAAGGAEPLLCAHFVPAGGAGDTAPAAGGAALREHCARQLPEAMVPGAFVVMDALPRTITGKLDRAALADPRLRAAAGGGRPAGGRPAGAVEELLAGMWCELFGVPAVRPEDDFFELGGHSLLVTRLFARVHAMFGVELDPRDFFVQPTLGGVAALVEARLAAGAASPPPPVRLPAGAPRPLSFGQERLWLLQQLDPQGAAYNMMLPIHVAGELDAAALLAGLGEIVRRHEVLRTVYRGGRGELEQVVMPPPAAVGATVDLSGLGAARARERSRELVRQQLARPFDLAHGPVLRCLLLRRRRMEHVLLIVVHHIACDDWSMEILRRELVTLYGLLTARRSAPRPGAVAAGGLTELPLQYADLAAEQRSARHGEALAPHLEYWRRQLAGVPPLLALPLDRPRPLVQTFRGGVRTLVLDAGVVVDLRALGRREGATLFMTLLAAFQSLLGRSAATDDVSIGLPIAGRERLETEELIGFFVNTLVLRTDLGGDPPFAELLGRVRTVALAAHAHHQLPFEKLVEEVRPQRTLQHSPLFQVMFVLQNSPRRDHRLPNLELTTLDIAGAVAKFDLSLAMTEHADGLRGELTFNRDLFDAATAQRWLEALSVLLAAAVASPAAPLSTLPSLGAGERAQLLTEWNDTAVAGAGWAGESIHALFARQAAASPGAPAVSCRGVVWSYGELAERAREVSRLLWRSGVGTESVVGVCMERTPALMAALLGVMGAGGAYLPLDPSYPRERLDWMVTDSGCRVVLTESGLMGMLPESVTALCLDDLGAGSLGVDAGAVSGAASAEGLAYVIYTSGSTGRPKGVEVSHRGVVNLLRSVGEAVGMDGSAVVLALTSLSFDIAGLELFMPLLFGGRVEIGERELGGDGRRLGERLRVCGATVLQATPSSWGLLVGSGWAGLEGLRGLCGGEALPGALAGEIAGRCAAAWNVYGPTETTIWSTLWRLERGGGRVSIGRPVANTDVYVLDGGLRVAPIGVCGQLYIGGMGLARGYRGRPELTAERFVPHPYGGRGGERLYATGDLARRLADGRLEYLGRGDQQVKVRGVRIELGEVEAALAAHPQVSEAVVAVRNGSGGESQLVGYFVASGPAPSASELRRFLGRSLPEAMLPQAYVELAALPLTPNRKVDRRALPEPEGSRPRLDTAYVAPQGAAERRIAALWCQVLGVDRVGVDDNFFDLGGHSLLLVQVHERLTASFPELPLIELFMHPTVAALARRLTGGAELQQQLAQAQAAHEATQVQQRLAGQERLRQRREAGRSAAAGGGA